MIQGTSSAPASASDARDPRGTMAVIAAFSGIAAAPLLVAPAVASQLQAQWGFTPTQAGDLFSIELGTMSLASLPALWWIRRFNLRLAATIFAAVFVVGNITSSFIVEYASLATTRGVTAFAGGSLMVVAITLATHAKKRDRAFGLWMASQITFGAIALAVLPQFFASLGVGVVYWTLAVLMACAIFLVRFLPTKPFGAHAKQESAARPLSGVTLTKIVVGLVACMVFYVGLSAVWTFVNDIAAASHIDNATASLILSLATVVGIISALAATAMGGRISRTHALLIGHLGMLIGAALLLGQPDALRFGVATMIFKFGWSWTVPFFMSTLGDLDGTGRASNLGNLAIGGGLAVGPVIAGRLIESTGGFDAVTVLGLGAVLVSSVFAVLAQARRASLARVPVENLDVREESPEIART